MADATQPTEITFEAGYERLKAIAERIDEEEVPVSEMCELFAEGKGLERALGEYLDTQQARLEEIERGEGVAAYRIVAAESEGAPGSPGSPAVSERAPASQEPPGPGQRGARRQRKEADLQEPQAPEDGTPQLLLADGDEDAPF
ncbi:MAG: exodeoxyribonuclease VII small subunit [Acidobacteriota bacterium]|nr:exodeoxyribonuclease VII small subunit [Acidobacteriota bacterium]